jgi:hypothetical protein
LGESFEVIHRDVDTAGHSDKAALRVMEMLADITTRRFRVPRYKRAA